MYITPCLLNLLDISNYYTVAHAPLPQGAPFYYTDRIIVCYNYVCRKVNILNLVLNAKECSIGIYCHVLINKFTVVFLLK